MSNHILPTHAKAMAAELLEEIEVLLQQKKYYPALNKIEQLFEINEYDNELMYKRAYLYYLVEEYDKAYHWLRVFSNNQGPDYRVYLLNAEIQIRIGKKDEAIKILGNFFMGYNEHYFTVDSEEGYDQLDKIIEKLKKSYKWSKLLRLIPALKDYESQRRKALKELAKKQVTKEQGGADILPGKDEVKTAKDPVEETPELKEQEDVQPEVRENLNSEEEKVEDNLPEEVVETGLAVMPPKDLATMPAKDVAVKDKGEMVVKEPGEVDTVPEKNVLNPMAKLVAANQAKETIVEDEFRAMTYGELLALIKELWDKGRLSDKQQRMVVRQKVEMVEKAVEGQVLSLKKKIWLFNYLANVYRQRILFDEAIYLLRAGLKFDDEDPILLKNLGYLLISNGEVAVAKEVLEDAKLKDLYHQDMDFTIIDLLGQC